MFVYNSLMDTESTNNYKVRKRKAASNVSFCVKKERNTLYQKVSGILQKKVADRSKDETEYLNNSKDVVEQIILRKAQRQKVKDRAQEYEDPVDILEEKCKSLAEAVINSNHLVVYTGAGISTAACIPDYRGSNGIWTLLQKGKDIGLHDLSLAEPTLTHMSLYCLYRSGILKHVVSQNCDGLHLRSGLPRTVLSEVHGNMYLEVCAKCKPCNHYLRLFDVTEYTARYSHETLRLCYKCGQPLKDTIVHFGERGKLQWPLNWDAACKQADKADVILCLGSSLKVLKKYPWLWCMDKPVKKRPKLYIVNLQWTPKDDQSTLKINGKCDTVIRKMMHHLGLTIPNYFRDLDPIFYHATILSEGEVHTTTRIPIKKHHRPKEITMANTTEDPDCSDSTAGIASMCSHTRGLTLNKKSESIVDEDSLDLTSFCTTAGSSDVDSKDSTVGLDMSTSDKENELDVISGMKPEQIATEDKIVRRKSVDILKSDSLETNVEEFDVIKTEMVSSNESAETKNTLSISTNVSSMVMQPYVNFSNVAAEIYANSFNLIYGRSLWSDLLLFDVLTNQPILFGPSILGWSAMNSYYATSPYPVSDLSLITQGVTTTTIKKEEVSLHDASSSSVVSCKDEQTVTKSAACSFCSQYYASESCLFYVSCGNNMPLDANVICLCCGGENEEDDQEEQEEDGGKNSPKVPNINPGWFGKGYRRKIKKRR